MHTVYPTNSFPLFLYYHHADEETPKFLTCPKDISTSTLPRQSTANVSWVTPDVWDNGGVLAPLHRVDDDAHNSACESEGEFLIGTTDIVYKSTDFSGNTAFCNFSVIVYGKCIIIVIDCKMRNKLFHLLKCLVIYDILIFGPRR